MKKKCYLLVIIVMILTLSGCYRSYGTLYSEQEIKDFLYNLDDCFEDESCELQDKLIFVDEEKSKKEYKVIYKIKDTDITFETTSYCITNGWYTTDCTYGILTSFHDDVLNYVIENFKKEYNISNKNIKKKCYDFCTNAQAVISPVKCAYSSFVSFVVTDLNDAEKAANYIENYLDYLKNFNNSINFKYLDNNAIYFSTIKSKYEEYMLFEIDDNNNYYLTYREKRISHEELVNIIKEKINSDLSAE